MQNVQRTGRGPNEAYLMLLSEAYRALNIMCQFAFKGGYPIEAKFWTTRKREREVRIYYSTYSSYYNIRIRLDGEATDVRGVFLDEDVQPLEEGTFDFIFRTYGRK